MEEYGCLVKMIVYLIARLIYLSALLVSPISWPIWFVIYVIFALYALTHPEKADEQGTENVSSGKKKSASKKNKPVTGRKNTGKKRDNYQEILDLVEECETLDDFEELEDLAGDMPEYWAMRSDREDAIENRELDKDELREAYENGEIDRY